MDKQGLLLYMNDDSPPSCAVVMLGRLLGLKFHYNKPDFSKMEHKSPEFKKINPMGTIPVLQDGEFIVSESHAIMKYLLNKYGGPLQEKFYPSEPQQRAIIDQCLYFDAGVLFPRLNVIAVPSFLHGLAGPTPQQLADVEEAYSVVEAYLQKNRYIAGDRMTIADLSLGTTVSATEAVLALDQNRFPRSVEWLARLQQEECFKEINNPGAAQFTEVLHMCWQKNKIAS